MALRVLSNILFTEETAQIFLRIDNKIIGRRLLHCPLGLFGFGRGNKCPNLISFG